MNSVLLVINCPSVKPIQKAPEGRLKIKLRQNQVARLFVKNNFGIREFYITDHGDHWEPSFEISRNVRPNEETLCGEIKLLQRIKESVMAALPERATKPTESGVKPDLADLVENLSCHFSNLVRHVATSIDQDNNWGPEDWEKWNQEAKSLIAGCPGQEAA